MTTSVSITCSPLSGIKHKLEVHWVFLFVWLLCSMPIAILTPIGCGLDEPMHIARAAQIAHGAFLPVNVSAESIDTSFTAVLTDDDAYGGFEREDLYRLSVWGNVGFSQGRPEQPLALPYWSDPRYFEADFGSPGKEVPWAFPNTSINSPVVYAPHVLGYAIASSVGASAVATGVLMRVFGSIAFGCIVAWSIWTLPVGKWMLAAFALSPFSVLCNSWVTADAITFAAASAFISIVMKVYFTESLPQSLAIILGIAACAVALSKITYLPIGCLLLIVPLLCKGARRRSIVLPVIAVAVCALLVFLLWYSAISGINTGSIWGADISQPEQIEFILDHPRTFIVALVRQVLYSDAFGLSYTPGWILCAAYLSCMVASCFEPLPQNIIGTKNRFALFMVLVWLLVLILIATALYLQFSPVGSLTIMGVQARYFLPIAILPSMAIIFLMRGALDAATRSIFANQSVHFEHAYPTVLPILLCAMSSLLTMFGKLEVLFI